MKASYFKKLLLLAAALVLALSAGCQYILPSEEEPLAPPLVAPKDVVYTTVDVERGDMVKSVQGVGRFESVSMVDLFFKAGGGRVKSINAKIGDTVKKGAILIQLDTEDLDFQLTIARLELKQMENSYASMQVQMKRAKDKSPLRNMKIDLDIKRLRIQQMEQQKENAVLRSPINGSVVYITNTRQGSWVDAFSTLVRVADPNVKMLTYTDDSNRAEFQIGMKVQVTLRSNNATAEGEVVSTPFERLKYDEEKLNKMLFIKVPDDLMKQAKVGDEAKIVLVLAERKGVLKLPRSVVKTYLQRRYVQALVNGVKVDRDVEVGLETATETEILSGLEEGDKVIMR